MREIRELDEFIARDTSTIWSSPSDPTIGTDDALGAAADELVDRLTRLGPDVRTARRVITADTTVTTSRS